MKEPFLYSGASSIDWNIGDIAVLARELRSIEALDPLLAEAAQTAVVLVPGPTLTFIGQCVLQIPAGQTALPAAVPLNKFIEALRRIWLGGLLNDLLAQAQQAGLIVQVPPDTINFIKRFLFKGGFFKKSELAGDVIRSASCLAPPTTPGGPPVFPPPGPGDPPPF